MNITYHPQIEDNFSIITARCQIPVFGRWVVLDLTTYCDSSRNMIAVNYGFRPLQKGEKIKSDKFNALHDGILSLSRGEAGHRQEFHQELRVPKFHGILLNWTPVKDSDPVHLGREISRLILRRLESIIETIRHTIRRHLSPGVLNLAVDTIQQRFGQRTQNALDKLLKEINWEFMFFTVGMDAQALTVIKASMVAQPWEYHNITYDGEVQIDLLKNIDNQLKSRTSMADAKATSLLRHVCGETLALEFEKFNKITLDNRGYQFIIEPGKFVSCTDPDGHKAQLCIHTQGFACNPIDEVVIAFLHIKHKFDSWMKMAVVHNPDRYFSKNK